MIRQPDSITAALARAATTGRGLRAIEHDRSSLYFSYDQLLAEALRIGGGLRARGLSKGDRVAIVASEVSGFVRAFFGVSAAGLVPVPLFPPSQAGDLETFARQSSHILEASRAAAVVASDEIAPLLNLQALDHAPFSVTVEQLLEGPALPEAVQVDPDATAILQFTSGSTAAPKGVVLTQTSVLSNTAAIAAGLRLQPTDVGVSWLPLYHDMGLIGMLLSAVYAGVEAVILSPVAFLKRPSIWLDAISTYRGTISFAPNFAFDLCVRRVKPSQVETLDLSSWRVAGCGAEPVRPDTLQAFADHFARAGFRSTAFTPSYGLAEHSLAISLHCGGLHVDTVDARRLVEESRAVPASGPAPTARLVACGRPFPGHDVRIVDDEGHALPERHVGRILARGPSVMRGYFLDPEATADALEGGWLRTGDLGYFADGEIYVCGRTKDLIIRQGKKYHPPDLEAAIADLRGIRSSGVAVFAISRVDEADEVVAVVEARASLGAELSDEVRRRVRETAGLDIDHVVVAPPGTIPRTTSGKVRRAETRARFQAGTLLSGGLVATGELA